MKVHGRLSNYEKNYRQRRNNVLVIALSLTLIVACGSGGNRGPSDDDDTTPISQPQSDIATEQDTNAEVANPDLLSPFNGFRLVSEKIFVRETVLRDYVYSYDANGKIIERYNQGGESTMPSVRYVLTANGNIDRRENLGQSGAVSQSFHFQYSVNNRVRATQSFNETTPSLEGTIIFNSFGEPQSRTIVDAASGSLFSERKYRYSDDKKLEQVTLSSPSLPYEMIDRFSHDNAGGFVAGKTEQRSDSMGIEESHTYMFDEAGNLIETLRYDELGAVSGRTVYQYEATQSPVVNLVIWNWLDTPGNL